MAQPLVIAYHLVWTIHGAWLPNDPRGSGSKTVRSDVIAELGALHFRRKKVQPSRSAIRQFHERAADALKHPLLDLDSVAIASGAQSFASTIQQHNYTCYACAIMPDHVHILIRKHKDSAEVMADNLKDASRQELAAASGT